MRGSGKVHNFSLSTRFRKIEKYPVKNNRFKLFNVLRSKDIDEGIDLANVYENWYEEICNSFIKFGSKTYNNALCEGINNKIEAIKKIYEEIGQG